MYQCNGCGNIAELTISFKYNVNKKYTCKYHVNYTIDKFFSKHKTLLIRYL